MESSNTYKWKYFIHVKLLFIDFSNIASFLYIMLPLDGLKLIAPTKRRKQDKMVESALSSSSHEVTKNNKSIPINSNLSSELPRPAHQFSKEILTMQVL